MDADGKHEDDPRSTWDAEAEVQTQSWIRLADLNSATNELASLYYSRMYKFASIVVSILTVLVGSKGLATVIEGRAHPIDMAIGVCEILLGVFATLLSNMELKNKSDSFMRRSVGYNKIASQLRVQLVLQRDERANKTELLKGMPERVEQLEMAAEPLPLRYRRDAHLLRKSGLWSHVLEERPRGAAGPAAPGPEYVYDVDAETEGNAASILDVIIGQRI